MSELQLVDAPSESAEVLFDCEFDALLRHDGFSLGIPEPIEGGYGPRTLTIPLRIDGSRYSAMQRHSQLARVLMRREFFVRYQADAVATPVWYHVTDAAPGDLSFDGVWEDSPATDVWRMTLTLTADPFALGERITLDPVSVSNDPATGGLRLVLPEIVGDAEAGLRLDITPGGPAGRRWLFSSAAHKSAAPSPITWQVGTGDAWTLGADVGAAVADAAYSGGSYRPITFATTPSMATRLSVTGNSLGLVPNGQYLVAARVARSDTSSTFALRFGQWLFYSEYGDTVAFDRGASTAAGHAEWVVLGEFRFPFNTHPAPADLGITGSDFARVLLQAQRLSGSGDLRVDAIRLIPVRDGSLMKPARTARIHQWAFGATRVVVDGDAEQVYMLNAFDVQQAGAPHVAGSFLAATPGRANVITILQNADNTKPFLGDDNSDDITNALAITVSYQPRWLWIGDGS